MASDLFEIGAVTAGLITENSLELRDPSVFYQIQRSVNHTDAVNGMTAGTVQVNPHVIYTNLLKMAIQTMVQFL